MSRAGFEPATRSLKIADQEFSIATTTSRDLTIAPSMGAVGTPADNAMIESFWGRMQGELLNRKTWKTRIELATAIHDYIEHWHNTRRRHSALGMRTPTEYETLHMTPQPSGLTQEPRLHKSGGRSRCPPNRGNTNYAQRHGAGPRRTKAIAGPAGGNLDGHVGDHERRGQQSNGGERHVVRARQLGCDRADAAKVPAGGHSERTTGDDAAIETGLGDRTRTVPSIRRTGPSRLPPDGAALPCPQRPPQPPDQNVVECCLTLAFNMT